MIEIELWVNLLAYHLTCPSGRRVRMLMAQAAVASGLEPRALSFKHSVQVWPSGRPFCEARRTGKRDSLFRPIAQVQVGKRPGLVEPRACKRRPKRSKWLKVPREQARQQVRKLGYYLPNG